MLNKFFSDCRYVPYLQIYSPTTLCDGAQMAIFGDFFASCVFSEPRAAGFRLVIISITRYRDIDRGFVQHTISWRP